MSLASRLIALARGLDGRLPDTASPIDLAEHGEPAVAAEIIIANLYEFDIVLAAGELAALERLAADLCLAPLYRDLLHALPCPGDVRCRARVLSLAHVPTTRALHELLAGALGFPDSYVHDWVAFNDGILRLVETPETFHLRDWDVLARERPRDAFLLLDILLDASTTRVTLTTSDEAVLDPATERARLRTVSPT